jgi:uncharacterized protein (DUF1800 family)
MGAGRTTSLGSPVIMAVSYDRQIEHLLRRAGFGARSDELDTFRRLSIRGAVAALVDYESIPDDVDRKIHQSGYVQITSRGGFSPRTVITDARQRWLFRMVHTNRPLQEKMTIFWHNHFATAYSKIAGILNGEEATRYMAATTSEDPAGVRGQIEVLRHHALGNFRDLLVEMAKDTAMLIWLDGRTNIRARPQENFAREIMELFTMGIGHYTEQDVYAAARVFTGWNLRRSGAGDTSHFEFLYNAAQHDTAAKAFTFPIYPDGSRTIPARPAADGMQDGLDFIDALAAHPETGPRLARKLFQFFVSEIDEPPAAFISRVAGVYYRSRYDLKSIVREVLLSPEFWDERAYFARYAWPVEFVVRAIKDIGWRGFSLVDTLAPLTAMGQTLFEPPDVNGWDLGRAWFSTGSMLARMNFAATLTFNQKPRLVEAAAPYGRTPDTLLAWVMDGLPTAPMDAAVVAELRNYVRGTGVWTGAGAQLENRTAGLAHLIAGSAEYQLI